MCADLLISEATTYDPFLNKCDSLIDVVTRVNQNVRRLTFVYFFTQRPLLNAIQHSPMPIPGFMCIGYSDIKESIGLQQNEYDHQLKIGNQEF